ncbi:MAG: hypothetical protein ACI4R5_03610 [Acetatifactor sp.]
MRRKKWCLILVALIISMTGCGSSMPEVTDEQMSSIGEYAAVQLLKYDANSRSRLLDAETLEREEKKRAEWEAAGKTEPTPTSEPEGMGQADNTPVVEPGGKTDGVASLEEYFELPEGIRMVYSGYQVCGSYPQGGTENFFSLDATEGKKLLVLSFQIENTTDIPLNVDLMERNAVYRVTINDSYTRIALTTMLLNDVSTYIKELPAQSGEEVVLLVELEQETADSITSISIKMKNESKTYTIQVL